MTYDQGLEKAKHAKVTQETGVAIYFYVPIAPDNGLPMRISMPFLVNIYQNERYSRCIVRKSSKLLPAS